MMETKNGKHERLRELIKSIINFAASISMFDVKLRHNGDLVNDYIQIMRNVAGKLSRRFGEVVDSQGQIVAGSENIASLVETTTSNLDLIHDDTTMNYDRMQTAGQKMQDVNSQNLKVADQVSLLENAVREIIAIVKGIRDIANQSRMLSINASIEAARAGSAGRGFAVVAQEMQNLSKNTEKFLTIIVTLLGSIDESIDATKSSIDKSSAAVKEMDEMILELTAKMEVTKSNMDEASLNVRNINEITDSFSKTTQTTTEIIDSCVEQVTSINDLAEHFEKVRASLAELENDFGNVDKGARKNAEDIGGMDEYPEFKLENDDFTQILNSAVSAHANWVKTVENMIADMQVRPLQTDSHKCGFGHYYYILKPRNPEVLEIWKKIEGVHTALHNSGIDVIRHVKENDPKAATRVLEQIKEYSGKITADLNGILKIVQRLSMDRISAFDA